MKITTTILASFCIFQFGAIQAQTLYLEDFESSPVTSILHSGQTQLDDGPSPCGYASRGNAADFNSANVNFQSAQNSTYYLAVNPESPCGSNYYADLTRTEMNFLGEDEVRFRCKYFKSSTLGFGIARLIMSFDNGVDYNTIMTEFTTTDAWDSIDISLPSFVMDLGIDLTISIGGGEGVAVDDLEIYNVSPLEISSQEVKNAIVFYPNPAQDVVRFKGGEVNHISVFDLSGKQIIDTDLDYGKELNISTLANGIYQLEITVNGQIETQKLVIRK